MELAKLYHDKYGRAITSMMICPHRGIIIHTRNGLDTFINKDGNYLVDNHYINNFNYYIDWEILEKYDHVMFGYFGYHILVVEKQATMKLTGSKERKIKPKYFSKFLNLFKS